MNPASVLRVAAANFLGPAPGWYKLAIVGCLVANVIVLAVAGPIVTGWLVILEFIFTLVMALKCYPLQPGGLLAMQCILLGLVSPAQAYHEVEQGLPVILLLVFMVAGIYFLRDLLLYLFTRLLVGIRSQVLLSFLFCAVAALLSAFLDALTVLAVIITIGVGFYRVYHNVSCGFEPAADRDLRRDDRLPPERLADLDGFRAFLRGLVMHAAVGTTLGGVCTLVGEPQNLIVGKQVGWEFIPFMVAMAPVTMPTLAAGLVTCLLLARLGGFGYGREMPAGVRAVLEEFADQEATRLTQSQRYAIVVQGAVAVLLLVALAFHWAEVGLIGLMVIVLATAFTGIVEEHQVGKAFEASLPFTALLVVFYVIVGVIHAQHLFQPLIDWELTLDGKVQALAMFSATGVLSMVSDNVFVATIYITEVRQAFDEGQITRDVFEVLAIAINTGTNIPSIATPNGQAAFLFLLTSALAPLIRLSYFRMLWMALPYLVTMTTAALLGLWYLL